MRVNQRDGGTEDAMYPLNYPFVPLLRMRLACSTLVSLGRSTIVAAAATVIIVVVVAVAVRRRRRRRERSGGLSRQLVGGSAVRATAAGASETARRRSALGLAGGLVREKPWWGYCTLRPFRGPPRRRKTFSRQKVAKG